MKNITTYSCQSLTNTIPIFKARDKRAVNTLFVTDKLRYKPLNIGAYILYTDGLFELYLGGYSCKIAKEDLAVVLTDISNTLNLSGKTTAETVQIIIWAPCCSEVLDNLDGYCNRFPENPEECALMFCYNNLVFCNTAKLFEQSLEATCKELSIVPHTAMTEFSSWMLDKFILYKPPCNKKGGHGYLPVTVTQMFQSILERFAYIEENKTDIAYSKVLEDLHKRIMVYSSTKDFCEQDLVGNEVGPLGIVSKHEVLHNDYHYLPKPPFIRCQPYTTSKVLYNICHYDATLAYGSAALLEKFPSTGWLKQNNIKKHMTVLDSCNSSQELDLCYKIVCTIHNLKCINYPWLKSKYVKGEGLVECHQGIISYTKCNIELTDAQYYALKKTYTWDRIEVHRIYTAKKDYLPKFIRKTVVELAYLRYSETSNIFAKYFAKKCGERVYGKGITLPDYSRFRFLNGKYHTDEEIVNYRWRKYLIRPEWSIYMQDYARLNLINLAAQFKIEDLFYCDTDCLIFNYKKEYVDIIEAYNAKIKHYYQALELPECVINGQIGQFKNEVNKLSNGYSNYYNEFIYHSTKCYAASYNTSQGSEEYAKASGIVKGTIDTLAKEQRLSIVNNFELLLSQCSRMI